MHLLTSGLDTQASDGRPVGVFDSGVGGLSVARELMKQCPAQPLV
jgi:glutamate racemase